MTDITKRRALGGTHGVPGNDLARASITRDDHNPQSPTTQQTSFDFGDKPSGVVGRVIKRHPCCHHCGSDLFRVEPGKAQHALHLRCARCGRGGTWMTRDEADRLEAEAAS
jgi:hypothetical protein